MIRPIIMADTEIRVDLSDFLKSSARLRAQLGAKGGDAETFMRARAKAIVKTQILTTPPGAPGVTGAAAKQRGAAAIAGDAAKAVQPTSAKLAESDDVRSLIEALRISNGRVSRPAQRTLVPSVALNAEIRRRQGEVGTLAAGLNAAAAKLGYKPPAWIWRHNSPGSIEIQVSARGIRIVMVNGVEFASTVRGLQSRLQKAIDEEVRKNQRQIDFLVEKAGKKAGFK